MARKFLYRRGAVKKRSGPPALVRVFSAFSGVFFLGTVLTLVAILGGGLGAYAYIAKDLPSPSSLATREVAQSTKILDRNGQLLFEIFDQQLGRRTRVSLKEVSPYLVQAAIATEDADFYQNQGVNIRGIVRAAWNVVTTGSVTQGGSSITQQLVKNALIPEEERSQISVIRKLKEMILSVELTRRFSKDEILEYYLNEINYGNLSYGIESAAQSYFGKSARDLDLAEGAMLAGIPQAPAVYSPLLNPEGAKRRQQTVLDLMVRQGFVTQAEADKAGAEELSYHGKPVSFDIRAPHFVFYVARLLEEKYGSRLLFRGGLKVTTTLDLNLQEMGQEVVREQVAKTSQTINAHNAALVAIDPKTGEILTMVGSADYFDESIDGQVNVTTAERQPGSSFKPFTYLTLFQKGFNPATMLLDIPKTFNDGLGRAYNPDNFNRQHAGPVSVREALANSMNIPAVRAIEMVGVDEVLDTAHKMGITTLNRKGWYGLSLTLGGGEVKLLDMTYAYSVLGNEGKMAGVPVLEEKQQQGHRSLDPVAILKIEDADGKVLEQFKQPQERQIIPPEYAYLITSILTDNAARAPVFGNTLVLPGGRPGAIKTGTTEDLRDFWQMGYTPELAVGVWMGNSNNAKLTGGFSSTTAGPIWMQFVNQALEGTEPTPFRRPPNVETATVCVPSGLLPTPECQRTKGELFITGQVPVEKDNLYRKIRIDKLTGLLAPNGLPAEFVEEKIFLVLPEEARDWAKEANIEQPPTETSPLPPLLTAGITSPAPGAIVGGTLTIRGTAGGRDVDQYYIEIGSGVSPRSWVQAVPSRKDAVTNNIIGRYETRNMPDGQYTLRLTIKYIEKKNPLEIRVPITVDNTKPVVRIVAPAQDVSIHQGADDTFWVGAEVADQNGIARVELYLDGEKASQTDRPPYQLPAKLTRGAHSLYVVGVDTAGNSAKSQTITVQRQ